MSNGKMKTKASVIAAVVLGAAGFLIPLSAASPAAAGFSPDHYCPITGITANGSCSLSGPSRIDQARAAASSDQDPATPRKYRASDAENARPSGPDTGSAHAHGGSPVGGARHN